MTGQSLGACPKAVSLSFSGISSFLQNSVSLSLSACIPAPDLHKTRHLQSFRQNNCNLENNSCSLDSDTIKKIIYHGVTIYITLNFGIWNLDYKKKNLSRQYSNKIFFKIIIQWSQININTPSTNFKIINIII